MALEDFFLRYWPLIAAVVGLIVWAVRLEGKMNKAASDIRSLWKQREEDQATAATSRKEVHDALRTLQSDVKDILKALGGRSGRGHE
jgi:hypothetical protein